MKGALELLVSTTSLWGLGHSFNLSEFPLPYLLNRNYNCYLQRMLWELNEIKDLKAHAQRLVYKRPMSVKCN